MKHRLFARPSNPSKELNNAGLLAHRTSISPNTDPSAPHENDPGSFLTEKSYNFLGKNIKSTTLLRIVVTLFVFVTIAWTVARIIFDKYFRHKDDKIEYCKHLVKKWCHYLWCCCTICRKVGRAGGIGGGGHVGGVEEREDLLKKGGTGVHVTSEHDVGYMVLFIFFLIIAPC